MHENFFGVFLSVTKGFGGNGTVEYEVYDDASAWSAVKSGKIDDGGEGAPNSGAFSLPSK